MFTGIVECTGRIVGNRRVSGGRRLAVHSGGLAERCRVGASLCVNGVCLTVANSEPETLEFDVIQETLDKSTLGSKRVGDEVNLERSLRIGDRLDGHFVQGHVDGTATVERVEAAREEHVLWLRPDACVIQYVIPKGSIAIDGVSLTVAAVRNGLFSVALIPTTLQRTVLSALSSGAVVNIESDIVVRTVVHRLAEMAPPTGVTLNLLHEAGLA